MNTLYVLNQTLKEIFSVTNTNHDVSISNKRFPILPELMPGVNL